MSEKNEPPVKQPLDERYSLRTYDGLLMATEDLFNRYLVPSSSPVTLEEIKGASTLLREARGILDSRRRANPKTESAEESSAALELTASGPFKMFQGGK